MMKVLSRLLCLVLCLPLLVMGQEKITWKKDGKEMVLTNEKSSTVEVDLERILGLTGGSFNFYAFKSGMSSSKLSSVAKQNGLRNYAAYMAQEKRGATGIQLTQK